MAEGDTPEGIDIEFDKVDQIARLPSPVRKNSADPGLILDEAAKRKESDDRRFQVSVDEVDLKEGLHDGDVLWMRDAQGNEIYYLYNGTVVFGSIRILDPEGNVTYYEPNATILGALQDKVLSAGKVVKGQGIKIDKAPDEIADTETELTYERLTAEFTKFFPPEKKHETPITEIRIIPTVSKATSANTH